MDSTAAPAKAPINWAAAIMFPLTTLPVLTVLPWYLATQDVNGWAWVSASPRATTVCGRTAPTRRTRR